MNNQKKFIVSHAPFLHNGSGILERNLHTIYAALPAVICGGIFRFGVSAIAVVCFSVATAMIWELLMNHAMKRPITIGDGHAALIGLLFAMLLPATAPWWLVLTGTFVAIVIGKQIFGGIGSNAFNPVVLSVAILTVSWGNYFDFNEMYMHFNLDFAATYPLATLKHFGVDAVSDLRITDFLIGRQVGGIGSIFGIGLIAGGIYLMIRGFARWEICLSYLAGIFVTAVIFNIADPARFAGPFFHICTGYTLIAAFFLVPEDASSPVNFSPMFIYGAAGGVMTVLIRNIGAYADGAMLAVLVVNLINPLLDKIRPKALGKVQ
ncbi:MAG: RnfABCDGE type electron transport complex subunit D [Deltaproteobacteria bacterium]